MAGIHLHPHDILDEGTERILQLLGKLPDTELIFPEVNTIFERNPYPAGDLPHNPVHRFVQGLGTLHAALESVSPAPSLYQKLDPLIQAGEDPLRVLQEGFAHTDYRIVPWVNLLNGDFAGEALADNNVYNYRGERVEHWLCPNGPDVVKLWADTLPAITAKYGFTTYLIDRIRFPDWAGKQVRPSNLFSCFCPHCRAGMMHTGIDPDGLILELEAVSYLLRDQAFREAVNYFLQSETIAAWIRYRQDSVSAFIERLTEAVAERNRQIELWLDLWPPSYAWLLGQDYRRLTRSSRTLKHFPYHKLGGGADVQGLIRYFAPTPTAQEEAFQAFLRFFGMGYDLSYETFCRDGFPLSFVKRENAKARTLSQPGTRIYSGIQMWNLEPEPFLEAVREARSSQADDLIYYCYGWADERLFEAQSGLD